MNFPQHDQPAALLPRAVTRSGRWIDNSEHDRHQPSSSIEVSPDLRLAETLLDAAGRMHDSSDPEAAREAIAGEALRLLPADGVIILAHAKNGLTPVYHLPRAGPRAGVDPSTALCSRLAAAGRLEPGHIPAQQLQQAQARPASGPDIPTSARWWSALVVDLVEPRTSRPTRLLWYATTRDAFTTTDDLANLFARHAGLALHQVTERHNLERAVAGRTVTGQATGILMHRYRITAEQAFALLRTYSQEHNLKLRDVADTISHTGALPT